MIISRETEDESQKKVQPKFENSRFDAVLSMNGIHAFAAAKYRSFCEIQRVLKKGGIFLGCFYIRGERRIAGRIVRF